MQLEYQWINQPKSFKVEEQSVSIITDPNTNFWQKTYYPFSIHNAPALVQEKQGDYTYSTKVSFEVKKLYDQAGILLYLDPDFWVKISFEYFDIAFGTIGVVVTNFGYSDWSHIKCEPNLNSLYLRVSRRGQDYKVEYSLDNIEFSQLRMFHLHRQENPKIGIYAASPLDSSFTAVFEQTKFEENIWEEFKL